MEDEDNSIDAVLPMMDETLFKGYSEEALLSFGREYFEKDDLITSFMAFQELYKSGGEHSSTGYISYGLVGSLELLSNYRLYRKALDRRNRKGYGSSILTESSRRHETVLNFLPFMASHFMDLSSNLHATGNMSFDDLSLIEKIADRVSEEVNEEGLEGREILNRKYMEFKEEILENYLSENRSGYDE